MIPVRTVSAPLGSAPFRKAYGAPIVHRDPEGQGAAPPPARKAPEGIPMPTPSAGGAYRAKASPVVPNSDAPAIPSPTPAAIVSPSSTAAPATPLPQGDQGKPKSLADVDAMWAACMNTATDEAGENIMEWAKNIWDLLRLDGINSDGPAHLWQGDRGLLFGGQAAGSAKRHLLVKERKIPHRVMGILSRVTPDNYDAIESELMDLPIRQSEDSEIAEVVDVFFKKAIRPEDSIYAPQYARLIQALVRHIELVEREKESHNNVSKSIRSAIVNRCKAQYENLPELQELQQAASRTDDPEMEVRRRELMTRLKANIGFLGQLFVHRLISERVVISVLYALLWGPNGQVQRNAGVAQDYEIEQFFTLLEVCGPNLSQESRDSYQSHYVDSLRTISEMSNCTMRTKVLALNCKEFIENGYVKRGKRSGPMKLEEYNRQAAEQQIRDMESVNKQLRMQQQQAQQQTQHAQAGNHPRSALRKNIASPTGTGPAAGPSFVAGRNQPNTQQPQQPQPMTLNEFRSVMDATLATAANADPAKLASAITLPEFRNVTPQTLFTYFVDWCFRPMSSAKWVKERKALGPVLRAATEKGALSQAQVLDLARELGKRCIAECSDAPNIFEYYCDVIEGAMDIFGFPCYNNLLRDVSEHIPAVPFLTLKRCVTAITKRSPERSAPESGVPSGSRLSTPVAAGVDFPANQATSSRIHLLPHLLRFVGYTFADPKPSAEGAANDGGESDEQDDEDDLLVTERENNDVLDVIGLLPIDSEEPGSVEIATFVNLMSIIGLYEDGIDIPINGKEPKPRLQSILPDGVKADRIQGKSEPRTATYTARKVISAVFIFARFNRKLMETLMGIVAKVAFDAKTDHCAALLMEVYETWMELDRKPSSALDTCLDTIFANTTSTFASSSAAEALFKEIERNGHKDLVPNTYKRVGRSK